MNIISFDVIDSTNLYLKNHIELDNLTLCVSRHQTHGRGRLGRTWVDNNDLLFSILVKEGISNPVDYTFLIAITISNVLEKFGLNSLIKWPNDIIVNDKKICGILLEGVGIEKIDAVIIGVGLNTNTTDFNNDLLIKATSIKLELNKETNNSELLNLIIQEFEKLYYLYNNNNLNLIELVKERFYLLNKEVNFLYKNEICSGKVLGLDEEGKIIIEANNNLYHIGSGEITLQDAYKKTSYH